MNLPDGLRKHGFRKWYERELMQSHAHLALTFVSTFGVFAAFEAGSTFNTVADRITDVLAVLVCGAVALWSLRRYLFLLSHAEAVANQADCPGCGTYARFALVRPDQQGTRVAVRCRKCEREWTIES